jgi:2-amino-4-hydroxy-6-hydroxymethyldihydropteridine diphosphokinase
MMNGRPCVPATEGFTSFLVGLGSSLGDRHHNLQRSIAILGANTRVRLIRCSPGYLSLPLGPARNAFLNGVVWGETSLSLTEFHALLQDTERRVGRRPAARWHDRRIDLDLLVFGQEVCCQPGLQVPHPQIPNRRFVLQPTADLPNAPPHPVLGEWRDLPLPKGPAPFLCAPMLGFGRRLAPVRSPQYVGRLRGFSR